MRKLQLGMTLKLPSPRLNTHLVWPHRSYSGMCVACLMRARLAVQRVSRRTGAFTQAFPRANGNGRPARNAAGSEVPCRSLVHREPTRRARRSVRRPKGTALFRRCHYVNFANRAGGKTEKMNARKEAKAAKSS